MPERRIEDPVFGEVHFEEVDPAPDADLPDTDPTDVDPLVPYGDFQDYSRWGASIALPANVSKALELADFDPDNYQSAGTSIPVMNSDGSYTLSAPGTYSFQLVLQLQLSPAQAGGTQVLTWQFGVFTSPHGAVALNLKDVRPPAMQSGQSQQALSDGSSTEFFVDHNVYLCTSDSDATLHPVAIVPKFDMVLEGFEYTVMRVA